MVTFRVFPTDVFHMLRNDHLDITRLMEDVLISVEEDNERLMSKLYDELMQHMHLEEKYLYPELEDKGVTRELIHVSLGQHEEIKRLLQEVLALDAHSEEWLEEFQKLQEIQEIHTEEEEQEVFPLVKNFLTGEELARMGEEMAREREETFMPPRGKVRRGRVPRLQI